MQYWNNAVKARFTDTRLIRPPHYYGRFALSLGREILTFSLKFDPLNTDTPLIWKLSMAPLMVHFNRV